MIRAFSAALEDEHLLVKRGVLDLMNQSLRLDGRIIAKYVQKAWPLVAVGDRLSVFT